jgi:hypothetical protein
MEVRKPVKFPSPKSTSAVSALIVQVDNGSFQDFTS